jgi:hypothetical protein
MQMPEYSKEDALAFIESMRLTVGGRTGFRWLGEKLSHLAAYIESVDAENARLNAYLDWADARGDYESYRAASLGADSRREEPDQT